MFRLTSSAKRRVALALALATAGAAGVAGVLRASDHQDTPLVEIAQLPDINDVYVFPGASSDRLVLAVTTASPTPAPVAALTIRPSRPAGWAGTGALARIAAASAAPRRRSARITAAPARPPAASRRAPRRPRGRAG